jgi:hypothetical protein
MRLVLSIALALAVASPASAGVRDRIQDRKDARNPTSTYRSYSATVQTPTTFATASGYSYRTTLAVDALDEVNVKRASRGLPPFARDAALTVGAMRCAEARATSLSFGHTPNDFAYLPPGASCSATGCAAWVPSMGWGSCATYEPYRVAGAAWVMGADGRRYMSLFVR